MKKKHIITGFLMASFAILLAIYGCRKTTEDIVDPPAFSITPDISAGLTFSENEDEKTVTLKNTGSAEFNYSVSSDNSWITTTPTEGHVTNVDVPIKIKIDRSVLQFGTLHGNVTIKGENDGGNDSKTIAITVINPAPDLPPVPQFTISAPNGGYVLEDIVFDASGCTDDHDAIDVLQVRWRWNNGENYTSWTILKTATHPYTTLGEKIITLEVKDSKGNSDTLAQSITIEAPEIPTLVSVYPSYINHNSALMKGSITSFGQGSASLLDHGFCWSLTNTQPPTINDNKIALGVTSQLGDFQNLVEGLLASTTYYFRAYAENPAGISYGQTVTFSTTIPIPNQIVETLPAEDITQATANAWGRITNTGIGITIEQYGHCWSSTNQIPTINDSKTTMGPASPAELPWDYDSQLQELNPGTLYYFRAYVKLSTGVYSYGSVQKFTTKQ